MGNAQALRRDVRTPLMVCVIAVLFWSALGSQLLASSFQRDFLSFYTGALLARTGQWQDLYNPQIQSALQNQLVPNLPIHFLFIRPPFYALFLAPISLLPVHTAYVIWLGIQFTGMAGVWFWAWRRFGPDSLVFCSFFNPLILGIFHAQDCVFLLMLMLGAWLLIERGRDLPAGVLLALALFKFHLFLLLPLAILLRRRWKLLQGYAAGGFVLASLSFGLVGYQGLRDYATLLTSRDLETLSPSPWMMVGVNAIAVNLGIDNLATQIVLGVALVSLVLGSALRGQDDLRWFWTAVLGSMMLPPHSYEYDFSSLLIPGLIVAFGPGDRYLKLSAALAMISVPYFMTVAGVPWAIAPSLCVGLFVVLLSGVVPATRARPEPSSLESEIPA